MSLPVNWMAAPVARALAFALVHFVWEGAVLALMLALALRWAGHKPVPRYTLACLTMLAMVVSFGLTLAYFWPTAGAVAMHTAPAVPDDRVLPAATGGFAASLPERLAWVVPFWIGGVLVFYLHGLGGWVVAQRLRRRGVVPASGEWQDRLRRLRGRLRLSRPVALMESCLAEVPVVIGFVRPVVLLPVGLLTGLSVEQVEAILIHELAHVRRGDYLVNVLQKVVEGLLFYHPAVWWVTGSIRTERENCCDDVVVLLQGDAHGYAATLAALEGNRWPAREPALAATGGNLMRRVRRLLHQPEGPRASVGPVTIAGIALLTAAAMLSAWQPAPVPAPQQAAAEPETPYQKWVSQDVAYIITFEERVAFERLTTDEEREHFIVQFWQRRDPTPGTPENEFKEEHYRRIAYANQHFASDVPGWQTDRGRMYIVYGPPDEKDTHAGGLEVWRYRYIEGVGDNAAFSFQDGRQTIAAATAPVVIHKVDPQYTGEARAANYRGTVLLMVEVDPSGKATNIRVLRSLGLGLDQKALEAVKQWTFRPGTRDGKPVTAPIQIEVNFRPM